MRTHVHVASINKDGCNLRCLFYMMNLLQKKGIIETLLFKCKDNNNNNQRNLRKREITRQVAIYREGGKEGRKELVN